MTLFQAPILTDGATHSAQQFRMLVRDLALGAEGITQGDDLKVTALSTPGAGVQVGDGSGIVRGRANAFQGSYAVCNIGSETVDIAATGGAGRSDMVVLRVEDPEYEGTLDPAADQIMYFEVISNVGSTATTVPGGRSAIPLARIDIPASTATITSGMIVDLRQIHNPRNEREIHTQSPASISNEIGASTTFSSFTTAAGWNIPIPEWATKVKLKIDISPLRFTTDNYFGYVRAFFGDMLTQQTAIDDNQGTGTRRIPAIIGDTITIPADHRGTTKLLRVQAAGSSGNDGRVSIDSGTTLIADVQFIEAPR